MRNISKLLLLTLILTTPLVGCNNGSSKSGSNESYDELPDINQYKSKFINLRTDYDGIEIRYVDYRTSSSTNYNVTFGMGRNYVWQYKEHSDPKKSSRIVIKLSGIFNTYYKYTYNTETNLWDVEQDSINGLEKYYKQIEELIEPFFYYKKFESKNLTKTDGRDDIAGRSVYSYSFTEQSFLSTNKVVFKVEKTYGYLVRVSDVKKNYFSVSKVYTSSYDIGYPTVDQEE